MLPPQELRTFFVSFATSQRRLILQSNRLCDLLLDVLRQNRAQGRFSVHAFVFMPNHVHLIVTPAADVSLEKAVQFIKGGFSFRAKRELNFKGEIWQKSFNEHRITDYRDYERHLNYVWNNPVKAGIAKSKDEFPYSSACLSSEVDEAPRHLQRSMRTARG